MKVLLAIKEEFANKIFEGSKKYEFRKSIFKDKRVTTVVVYVSSPVQRVIGEFEIDIVIKDDPKILWVKTSKFSGITKEFFDNYFENREKGYAIKIKKALVYDEPRTLFEDYNIKYAPQSFMYLKD